MTILIAEDEADIRNLIRMNLEDAGYTVLSAKNGKEALDLFQVQKADLAILDVMMPILDGFNLLQKMRQTSAIPVIFLTARGEEMDKVLGLGLGADDYLVKPFSMNELLARVAAHLRRFKEYHLDNTPKATVIRYGDLVLDKESCSVCRGKTPLELGAKEFKLLSFFLENPEKVFTKQQLYRAVWEDEFYGDDNTVMVHISRIRNKIETNPDQPRYLKTIRGIGYKLHDTGESV